MDAIESVLEGRASSDVESYSIAGRSITKIPISELLTLRAKYKAEVEAQEAAENVSLGLGSGKKIVTRF